MIIIRYALIMRDENDKCLGVIGTHREPMTKHRSVTPPFRAFCFSCFRMHPAAVCIETVAWSAGVDLDQAPVLLAANRTDQANMLAYSFPEVEVEA